MINLIFNADDFGYSKGVNYGIIDAHVHGVVNSATIMMNMPGAEHAIELTRNHPNLRIGIHLVLTCGRPLLENVTSLVDKEGNFFRNPTILAEQEVSLVEVEREWRKQISSFLTSGLTPSHLDSHHHVHTHPLLHKVIEKLAVEFNLPVRWFEGMDKSRAYSDRLIVDFYGEQVNYETLDRIVNDAEDEQTIEIMTHPAYIDNALINGTSYWRERMTELDVLTTWQVPSQVKIV